MLTWILILLGTVGIVLVLWGLHRFCIALEDRGYLHYRKSTPSGGVGGVFAEIDQLVRPSMEHVQEAQEQHWDVDEAGDPLRRFARIPDHQLPDHQKPDHQKPDYQ